MTAVAMTAFAIVASCGGSKFIYINNGAEKTFFKVPGAWKLYRLTQTDLEGRLPASSKSSEILWHVAFDQSSAPDASHLDEKSPGAVVGSAEIYGLSNGVSDQMSISRVRTLAMTPFDSTKTGFDPILQDPGVPAKWEVVSNAMVNSPKGLQGTRVVVNVPADDTGKSWTTVDSITMFDAARGRAYLLTLWCEAACYKQNRGAIDEIATSWKVNI